MDLEMKELTTLKELREAQEAHTQAVEASRITSSAETATRNRLNAAQKAFDKEVEGIRAKAPWNTDWEQERKRCAKVVTPRFMERVAADLADTPEAP